jgi:acyl dehydratase
MYVMRGAGQMFVRYFEDFQVGESFLTPARTITESDVINFVNLSGNHNEIHTNREYCKSLGMTDLVPPFLLVVSIVAGLIQRTGLFEGSPRAFKHLDWRAVSVPRIGDTIHATIEVAALEPVDNGVGLLRRSVDVLNQDDTLIHTGFHELLLAKRPTE